MIDRTEFLNRLQPFIDKPIIKVLVGQRRVGKSTVLKQLQTWILDQNPKSNLVYVDMERLEFSELMDQQKLYQYIKSKRASGKKNYLFIDEIQEVSEFERCVRSLLNEGEFDIYLTGSNANLLSGELATLLSGRYIAIQIHGLSYGEFLDFHQLSDSNESIRNYLDIGGLPFLPQLGQNAEVQKEYIKSLYATILLRDVVAREGIRNVYFLENLVSFLAQNTGSLISAQNISQYLKSQQVKINTQTVLNYLRVLANAFLIYKVQRAEIQGLKIFEVGEKYYFEDLGIRHAVRQLDPRLDIQKRMENAVFMYLKRHQYQVFVGKLGDKEIDFLGEKDGQRLYVQVCYQFNEQQTVEREYGNLLAIKDNFPKIVVTLDEFQSGQSYKGIETSHLRQFLLKKI